MASLQKKGDSWHCQFLYKKQRRTWVIGAVEEIEANAIKAKVEYLLMRIKQRLIDVPSGMDIVDFLICDGKPPDQPRAAVPKGPPPSANCEIPTSAPTATARSSKIHSIPVNSTCPILQKRLVIPFP